MAEPAFQTYVPSTVEDVALQYALKGFWVTPTKKNDKGAFWPNWPNTYFRPNEIKKAFGDERCGGLGIIMGRAIRKDPMSLVEGDPPHIYLYSLDVDTNDPFVLYAVEQAIGPGWAAKFGSKGCNYFVWDDKPHDTFLVKNDSQPQAIIEFFGAGRQVVIPPTIHPKTKSPYVWRTPSLLDIEDLTTLPKLDDATLAEIRLIGKGSNILNLNAMQWCGVDGGGNTHEVCVAAVASMVSLGWSDDQILRRIDRAKAAACERAGDSYYWPDAERVMQGWIDSARGKGYDEGAPETASHTRKEKKERKPREHRPSIRDMADWACAHLGGVDNLWKYVGQLRRYEDGYWPAVSEDTLGHTLVNQFPKSTSHEIKAAISTLKMMVKEQPSNNLKAMCLLNGTYELDTGNLRAWDKSDRLMMQLPFPYDPDAVCPNYDSHVKRLFAQHKDETYDADIRTQADLDSARDDSIETFDEFCGLTLVDDMSFQKALVIRGDPGGGKGTLIKLIEEMHRAGKTDVNTVGGVMLHDLNREETRTSLVGKLINISPELNAKRPLAVTEFKAIVGEDAVTVRRLYEDIQPAVKLRTRFMAFCNVLPDYEDTSGAIERRLLILPCDNSVPEDHRDHQYFETKLLPELPGVFNRWTSALRRLYARRRFAEPSSSKRAIAAMRIDNDTVMMWLYDRAEMHGSTPIKEKAIPVSDAYADYRTWCEASGYRPLAANKWSANLKNAGIPPVCVRVGGNVVRCRRINLKTAAAY